MKVNSISNQNSFNGRYIYDYNLSINQLKNFRTALKDVDVYDKDYDIKIFNDLTFDKKCKNGGHFVCVSAENKDKNQSYSVFINPDEQRKLKMIKLKVMSAFQGYEEKYNSLWGKIKNFFCKN